jgi:hypothetical protein
LRYEYEIVYKLGKENSQLQMLSQA